MNSIKSFVVGGAVRDKLMGVIPKDFDYVVVGSNGSELMALGFEQVGMGFPVFLHPHTGEEYALARREKKVGAGYTGFEFETGLDVTLEEDLERRDLTINSMARDEEGHVVDPFDGQIDLKNRVLRHTSAAFGEDPLRVVRLARFFARYDTFTVAGETMSLCSDMVDRGDLDELPDERFWREIEKAFADGCTARFWELLFEVGALQKVNFFKRLLGINWGPGRFMRLIRVANAFSKLKSFSKEEMANMFAAAIAPSEVFGLFNSAEGGRVYQALQRIRSMPTNYTALDMHELIMSVRGYSDDNSTLDRLCKVMCALDVAGDFLPMCSKDLRNGAVAGRQVTAQVFITEGFEGKNIGMAMALNRVKLIELMLNL